MHPRTKLHFDKPKQVRKMKQLHGAKSAMLEKSHQNVKGTLGVRSEVDRTVHGQDKNRS